MAVHSPHPRRNRRIGMAIAGFACGLTVAALVSALPFTPSHAAASVVLGAR